jgi:hypothetical protein
MKKRKRGSPSISVRASPGQRERLGGGREGGREEKDNLRWRRGREERRERVHVGSMNRTKGWEGGREGGREGGTEARRNKPT